MPEKRAMNLDFPIIFKERATGIGPASEAWEASILPMNYARSRTVSTSHEQHASLYDSSS